MADQNLTQKTAATSADVGDIAYIIADPSGTPLDRKIAVGDLVGLIPRGKLVADGATAKLTFSGLTGDRYILRGTMPSSSLTQFPYILFNGDTDSTGYYHTQQLNFGSVQDASDASGVARSQPNTGINIFNIEIFYTSNVARWQSESTSKDLSAARTYETLWGAGPATGGITSISLVDSFNANIVSGVSFELYEVSNG